MGLAKPVWPALQAGHPLARGLISAWPLYEGAGGTLNDLGGQNYNAAISGAVWTSGPDGAALNFNGASRAATTGTVVGQPSTNRISVVVAARLDAALATAGTAQTLIVNAGSTVSPGLLASTTDNSLAGVWNNVSGEFGATTGLIFTIGLPFVAILVVQPGFCSTLMYDTVKGLRGIDVSETTTIAPVNTAWIIGNASSSQTTRFWPGIISYIAVYNRNLSTAEMRSMALDVYQIFRAPSRRWEALAGATTGTLFAQACI